MSDIGDGMGMIQYETEIEISNDKHRVQGSGWSFSNSRPVINKRLSIVHPGGATEKFR